MFKNILTHMTQVEIWQIISLVFFVAFFVGMLIWALRLNKSYVSQVSQIPLHDNELN